MNGSVGSSTVTWQPYSTASVRAGPPKPPPTSSTCSLAASWPSCASARVETRIGTLEFTHDFVSGFPTDATVEKLYDERDFQRACQAYG